MFPPRRGSGFDSWKRKSTGANVARRLWEQRHKLRGYEGRSWHEPVRWPIRYPGVVRDAVQWVAQPACLGCTVFRRGRCLHEEARLVGGSNRTRIPTTGFERCTLNVRSVNPARNRGSARPYACHVRCRLILAAVISGPGDDDSAHGHVPIRHSAADGARRLARFVRLRPSPHLALVVCPSEEPADPGRWPRYAVGSGTRSRYLESRWVSII